MKKILLILATLVFIAACKEEKKVSSTAEQMKLVMKIHDDVMPKMGKISTLTNDLQKKIDAKKSSGAEEKAIVDLKEANEAMMEWMRGFMVRFDPKEINDASNLNEEKQIWLNEAEEKVKVVQEKMLSSIKTAEVLLK